MIPFLSRRFLMAEKLDAAEGADSFRLSNPSVWHQTMHLASLEVTSICHLQMHSYNRSNALISYIMQINIIYYMQIFHEATMAKISRKQFLLTGYLEWLVRSRLGDKARILTPSDPSQRGSQLSLVFDESLGDFKKIHAAMRLKGIVVRKNPCEHVHAINVSSIRICTNMMLLFQCDFRHPSVFRVAPAPLYNTFDDVWRFVDVVDALLQGSTIN